MGTTVAADMARSEIIALLESAGLATTLIPDSHGSPISVTRKRIIGT